MPEYKQVVVAGNIVGANAFRAVFNVADHSDLPQLTAWDNEQMTTTAIECLAGTVLNLGKSMVCARSTNDGNAAAVLGWATALAQSAGGAVANRLRGAQSYVLLGTTPPVAPYPVHRTFQFAFAVEADSTPGSIGYQPAIAVKVFYTGAVPTVNFAYNEGTDGVPVWVAMTSAVKGTAMALAIRNAIHATGPDTVGGAADNGVLDPVTKPGSGEAFATEYWVRTL